MFIDLITSYEVDALHLLLEKYQLPWLRYDHEIGKFVLVVDNHLLSTHRTCADAFMLMHVQGHHPKPGYGVPNLRRWYLDFGLVFHKMMESYYKEFRNEKFDVVEWSTRSWIHWDKMNIDGLYAQHPEYQQIGGYKGFVGILLQYAHRFKAENEKLRILGTEIAFGKNREIVLYENERIIICLAGRMDVIVDDGFFIMPMDHKTTGTFKNDPLDRYIIDEGPTGYIYALKKILPKYVPEEYIMKRDCHRILINMIAKNPPVKDTMDRFRRLCIWKTDEQLALYEQRMIVDCENLIKDLARFSDGVPVARDTSHCTNWFFGKCMFFDVHRQNDLSGEQTTLSNGFVRLPIWDTENISLNGV